MYLYNIPMFSKNVLFFFLQVKATLVLNKVTYVGLNNDDLDKIDRPNLNSLQDSNEKIHTNGASNKTESCNQ